MGALIVVALLLLLAAVVVSRFFIVVPQQHAYVVERLGQFGGVLDAGFHILVPFVDVIRYRHVLKEQAIGIPEQVCVAKDDTRVAIAASLSLRVLDAEKASYAVDDYARAVTKLAQTALDDEVGKLERDRIAEQRREIALQVAGQVDRAAEAWGVKVLRYEIEKVTPQVGVGSRVYKE